MRLLIYIILPLLILSALILPESHSQVPADSKGTEFWLTFPPNYHNHAIGWPTELQYGDSLYIFITSEVPTKGNIRYRDHEGIFKNQPFQIADPAQMYIFAHTYQGLALRGYLNHDELISVDQNETPVPQHFHITSDNDISVYAQSQAHTTSDALLVYPKDALGFKYRIMSYFTDHDTPSQFAILATEDNTGIKVTVTDPTRESGEDDKNIILDAGESYLFQARRDFLNDSPDLTGSYVESDKPVAVFAGHQRAYIPKSTFGNPSRDYLIQQMIPLETWGTNAFIIPFADATGDNGNLRDLFRLVAAYDGTDIFINGSYTASLNAGEYYEDYAEYPLNVESSRPVMAAQFRKTTGEGGDGELGDPFMMLIHPKEQYNERYRVINLQTKEYNFVTGYREVYEEQFLSVILPKSATNTLILDGLPANAVFNDIPTSDYAYANIPVSVGVHEIEAAKPMALYAYGYGYANSYGYIGGMSFKILDHMPPEIMSQKDCFSFSGVINDTTEYDSGIERVEIHAQENVANLNIGQFGDSIKTVAYSGAVADPYKDTRFILRAFDYQNIRTSDTITIPGFTVSLKGDPELQQIPEYLSEIPFIRDHCFNVTLENYGSFQQEFDINELFDLPDLNVQMNPTGTVVLTPGDELDITICLDPEIEMIVSDTLRLKNKCSSRDIAVFKLNALDDPNPPAASVSGDDCNREFIVVATDSLKSDFGFGDYEIIEQENCVILPEYQDIGLIRLKIEVTDPLLDATYKIAFYDLADKSDTVSAVIPGFTLNILSAGGGPKYIDSRFGAMRCDTVLIENYGNYPLELDKLLMEENIYFSVPLSQFPLTVNPGDSARVAVCFRPMSIGETLNDKLKLIYNCLEKNLEVEGEGKPLAIKSENKCGITIGFSSDDNSSAGAGAVYPNPAGDELNILINNQIRQPLNLQIFDTNGSVVAKEFYGPLPQGENTLKLDLDNISNGVYYYRISSGIFSAGGKFSVIK